MKVIIQRSKKSNVKINGAIYNSIDKGMVVLVGFCATDNEKIIKEMANKIVNLRIFDDEEGVMNKSIIDVSGEILSISQFTLYANTKKGNRPSYTEALKGELATDLYDKFNELLSDVVPTKTGVFGADMLVTIENNGPVTIMLEK